MEWQTFSETPRMHRNFRFNRYIVCTVFSSFILVLFAAFTVCVCLCCLHYLTTFIHLHNLSFSFFIVVCSRDRISFRFFIYQCLSRLCSSWLFLAISSHKCMRLTSWSRHSKHTERSEAKKKCMIEIITYDGGKPVLLHVRSVCMWGWSRLQCVHVSVWGCGLWIKY